ncbi:MAG: hypothetical protein MUF31_08425 [Akkermansiaceae bacterium]|jgi:hypothetical protein|nr:hypothetical protein [Akkermansiaceae bacterium]
MNLRPLAVFLCMTLAAFAQNDGKVSLRTLCFQHVDDIREVQVLQGPEGKESGVPVKLFTSAFSDAVEISVKDGILRFAVPVEDAEAGKPAFRVVAEAKSPGGERQLAIFFPSGDKDMPYRVSLMDESESSFPMGSTRIYNLTPTDARFTIGERAAEIASGKMAVLDLPEKVNALNQATVRFYLKNRDGEWEVISSTVWQATDGMRGLALAFLHPTTKTPTVNCLQETPPWRLPKLE